MASRFRVTYATLSAENDELQAAYDEGLQLSRTWQGGSVPVYVNGRERTDGDTVDVFSPADTSLRLARVHVATRADVDEAVAVAQGAGRRWSSTPWAERIAVLRRAADIISDRSNELAALMSREVGKNRLEALGDVEESADLIRYYCLQIELHEGFDRPMDTIAEHETTRSVLRPYGVWGVISPFNFPMALAAGPVGAALATGNTVVLKPSPQGSICAGKLFECFRDAGLPAEVLHVLPGGDDVGRWVAAHPDLAGLTFTGSYDVGMSIYRGFAGRYPKPAVCEMGGKNAAIVMASADIDAAATGIVRSAFGFSGQKCSACSRVYVERSVHETLLAALSDKTRQLVTGDPTARDTFVGPVIDSTAVDRFETAVTHARAHGRVVIGGEAPRHDAHGTVGHYVTPTVVTDLPTDDRLFRDELFVPLVAVAPIDSLDEAIDLADDHDLALTAGFYSADEAEVQTFLERIEAGVVYINRAAGATTGAWPGVQPFGGWKGSGSSGKAGGGLYYVQQYLREQSQTVVS